MNICCYSPYFPNHFGGGEKHLLDVALAMATIHTVSIAVAGTASAAELANIKLKYEVFFNCSLKHISFINCPIPSGSFLKKILWTKQFDYLYYVTDGSLFFSLAKRNNVHIQIPFPNKQATFLERLKLKNWQVKNTNSNFTKQHIEKNWNITITTVIQPLVEIAKQESSQKPEKEKILLNVGRFFKQLHSKRQDVLVKLFSKLISEHPKEMNGWKLVLIGNPEDLEYVAEIAEAAKNLPIEIHTAVSRTELLGYYQRAQIYWHATGYGVNPELEPEKLEHFGITTLEAMAAGAIPVVINAGGQPEVLGEELKSLLWSTDDECIEKTINCITNQKMLKKYQELAVHRAMAFDTEHFIQKVIKMLEL